MGWADNYIKKLQAGEIVQFRPRGNSMTGKVNDGQLVTVAPQHLAKEGDVVLCKVGGRQYLHLVKAQRYDGQSIQFQIGNNKGRINGWTKQIYGVVTKVED